MKEIFVLMVGHDGKKLCINYDLLYGVFGGINKNVSYYFIIKEK